MAECECSREPLSPIQFNCYYSKLLAFNANSLQIKRFLSTRNATRIELKKTAELYKFEGKCMPGEYNGYKVIDLKTWDRPTKNRHVKSNHESSADISTQTHTNFINRCRPENPLADRNNVSNSSVGNICTIAARRHRIDSNCIIQKARKLQPLIENPSSKQGNKTISREVFQWRPFQWRPFQWRNGDYFNGGQYPVDISKEQGLFRTDSQKLSVSLMHGSSPFSVNYEGDKLQYPFKQFCFRKILPKPIGSPTSILINNNKNNVSSSISETIDLTMEVENFSDGETSNPDFRQFSSENIDKSSGIGESFVGRKLYQIQVQKKLIAQSPVSQIFSPHPETRNTASNLDRGQLPLLINANHIGQDSSPRRLPINKFHSMSHSSSHPTQVDVNKESSLSKKDTDSNCKKDLPENSSRNFSVLSATSKSDSLPDVVNPKVPETIDLVLSDAEEDMNLNGDTLMLNNLKESEPNEVNIEQCIEEVRKVIRDHLEYKANRKSQVKEGSQGVETEEECDEVNKSISDKQQKIERNYKKIIGIKYLNSDAANSLTNEGKFKSSSNDQSSNHIDDNNQSSSDKYDVNKTGEVINSLPRESNAVHRTTKSKIYSVKGHVKIPNELQKSTRDEHCIIQDKKNDSTKNDCYEKLKPGIQDSQFLENVLDQLRSNYTVTLPALHNEETVILWKRINYLLSTNGLQFINKLFNLGLIRRHQKCRSPLEHNDRSMKLIQVQNERLEKKVLWYCNHCQGTVTVFHDSIFEGAKLDPSTIIKIIYYWCIHTHSEWLMSKENLHYNDVVIFYTRFRAVCTAALQQQILIKLGGYKHEVQMSYVDLFIGERIIILGALETEKNLMVLKAIPVPKNTRNAKYSLILNELSTMVQSDSEIVIDCTFPPGGMDQHQLESYYASFQRFRGDGKTRHLAITTFLNSIWMEFKNKYSESERSYLESIQLILNEMVWRRQCNYSPVRMFHTFIGNVSLQNSIDLDTLYTQELDRVAASPILNFSGEKQRSECIDGLQNIVPKVIDQQEVTESSCSHVVEGNGGKPFPNSNEELFSNDNEDDDEDEDINLKSRDNSFIIIYDDDSDDNKTAQKSIDGDNNKNPSSKSKLIASLNEHYCGVCMNNLSTSPITMIPSMNCALCSAAVTDNIDMMRHLFLHALSKDESCLAVEKLRNYCRHCLFTCKGSMSNHEVNCNSKPKSQTTCLICLASFKDEDNLLSHMQENHVQEEIPYGCKVCGFRISEYRYIIDHFYKKHKGDKYIQCPFCLQVYTFITFTKLDQSVCVHFYNHIKKHLLIGVNRYCYKCCLSFVTDRMFETHTKKDHVTCKTMLVKYTALGPNLDDPISDLFLIKRKQPENNEIGYKFDYQSLNLNHLPLKAKCIECRGLLSVRNHFPGHFQCDRCTYSTYCSIAIHNHIADYHKTKDLSRLPVWPGIILSIPMICECGFLSCFGNKLAEHLVFCGKTNVLGGPWPPQHGASMYRTPVLSSASSPLSAHGDHPPRYPAIFFLVFLVPIIIPSFPSIIRNGPLSSPKCNLIQLYNYIMQSCMRRVDSSDYYTTQNIV